MDGSRTEEVMVQLDPQDRCSEEDVLMDHYKILKTLGKGNFAKVKLALHLFTQVPVALKTLEKGKTNTTNIENEVEIMKFLDHPNIIKLFHVMKTTEHIYLVLEYASGGDLASRILEVDYIPEVEVQHIFTQLVCAVKYCHDNNIAHRDIKPENILMDANKNVKLCDFGLAIKVSTEPESTVFCGTLPYCAPELFSSQGYDLRALDIWSMGVVLYIMVTKHYPFKGKSYEEMKMKMQKPHYYIPPKLPVYIASLIRKLFTTDPRQRPKIHDIMEHQWLKGSEEFSKPTLSLETHSNKPSPSIMAAMWGMGYSPKDIRDSLCENNFDSIMATYLILKYESPWVNNTNHKAKLMQPNIAMAPADPPTCHYFLKSIGSELVNSTSTLPAKYQSLYNKKNVKKDRENHSMPATHCCQQKSQPNSTGMQDGPSRHDHEQLLRSSLQKRGRVAKGLSCGPLQHGHEHLLSSRASKSMSCGPVLHIHEYHLCSSLQKRDIDYKSIYCGPVQHNQDEHLLSITLKKSSKAPSVSCDPVLPNHEPFLCSSLQTIKRVSNSVSCGPVQPKQDEHLLSITLQKRSRAFKSLSCGPVQPNHDEQLLSRSLHQRSRASKSLSCGPVLPNHEQHLDSISENHITQVEAQNENPHRSSSFLQHTPSSRSSEEGLENVTATDAHQDKSLTPQETLEPNLTSLQPQRVTRASPRLWGGWKQVKRRMVKGLRRLCCCLPAERSSHTFQRRVAPQEGGDDGVT